jgi:prophage regulatory protein
VGGHKNSELEQFFLCFDTSRADSAALIIEVIGAFHLRTTNDGASQMDDSENPTAQTSAPTWSDTRILRLKEVCRVTGLGRSYIYQLQAEGQFPQSIKLGVRAVGWLEKDVQNWVNGRVQSSRSNL